MTNSETKNFSQNASSSYHLGGECSDECKKDSLNVPKLRFKGYNEEWVEKRIEKVLKIKHGKDKKAIETQDGRYPILATSGEIGRSNTFLWNKPCVLIGRKGTINKPQYMDIPFWTVDTLFYSDVFQENNAKYLYYLFNTINWEKYDESTGVPSLSAKTIERIKIKISNNAQEQEKIASFLTLIDKKIEKQKELVGLLKKYKRGLLSQIFSQKLRFKDKNGNDYQEWEECKFDEIFQILGNNTLSRECLNYTNIGVKNIHYGDILVKYHTCINDEIDKIPNINSDINLNKIPDDNYLTVGDVILADTAEDYTVGKTCEIVSCNTKILSGLHTIPCRPKRNFAKGYLGYYLNSAEYHDKLIPLITGIKVSSISKKEIKKTIIKYPVYNEQKKIANLLLLIENKLNLNIKRLELFETYKKGLLQQLFI